MKLCVIGSGYVGLVAGAAFAESGNTVICVDVDSEKIEGLNRGIIPIYEPGLKELVERNVAESRLFFSTDLKKAVQTSLICFIAVGTPPGEDGSADLSYVLKVATDVGACMDGFKIIVDKSTVPVGTADRVRKTIAAELEKRGEIFEFDVVSNPEFLKEGSAIEDFMKPDRVIIGTDNVRTAEMMKELYEPFMRKNNRVIVMDIKSAEMTKYAANAMLATRITFMNQIANLCEHLGADVVAVREGIGSDSRIGYDFLFPGVGYGGSCFPKDVQALVRSANSVDYDLSLLKAVEDANYLQKQILGKKISRYFAASDPAAQQPLAGRKIAVWGLAFKPKTDDLREAPSLVLIEELLSAGAIVTVYDPVAMPKARAILGERVCFADNAYQALEKAEALAIVTEWNEFRRPDFERVNELMAAPVIFDGRNLYEPKRMSENGFTYFAMGRGTTTCSAP
ncbi:MAG: UDP-glucose/GDP-mannose dehydrogenase family protein [Desulfuromonadales bacterium]|nr:UDP-glucose/GDP-mannose dehydrogenase family protein [Desulfuromonadales bacterium]